MANDFSLFTSLRFDVKLKQVPAMGLAYAGWNYRNESPLYMLDYHRDRILRAAAHWGWDTVVDKLSGDAGLANLARAAEAAVDPSETGPFRLRILVTKEGIITFHQYSTAALDIGNLFPEALPEPGKSPSPSQPQVPPRLAVVVDSVDSPRSEFTHFKTTNRKLYDEARERAEIGSVHAANSVEVLVINQEDNSIMEGSTTTPYFWRDGRWITPPVSAKYSRHDGSGGNDGTSRRWALERRVAAEREIRVDQLVDGEACYISNGVSGFRAGTISLRVERTND
ncbi:Aminotransferase, class IV [Metarhizium album ARSEF 1941]|uniref:Aminotransferase, class IV n=1 Tax=Metarhizium album (strain ARSEF 1941) TaxID=1081103 RepID=A0A0B2WN21_METAS|nr:Aminotransferase, class IV [Metarhizium album ARSEF 1941]KHN95079.1 Aminotransferase, class IV [Metarhizium album ARSEF 1941]